MANHFQIEVPKQGFFYHYDVEIEILREPRAEMGDGDARKKLTGLNGKPVLVKPGKGMEKPPGRISKDMKRKIMKAVLAANPDNFLNGNKPGFDGEKNIYTMKEFNIGKNENKVVEVIIPKDPDGNEVKVRVTVKPCTPLAISWAALQDVIDKKSKEVPLVVIQVGFFRTFLLVGNESE